MARLFWICTAGALGTGTRYLIGLWAEQRLGKNRRRDANERLSGEMIHTTSINEGQSYQSNGREVYLFDSHGCIHIKPIDRQKFLDAGAFRKGTTLIIHSYDELFDPDKYR